MAEGFFFGDQQPSPGRRRLAEILMQQGLSSEPVTHWAQGAANAAKAMLGAYQVSKQDAAEREATAGMMSLLGSGSAAPSRPDTVSGGAGDAATGAAPSAPSTGPASEREVEAARYYVQAGLSPAAAAALAGNQSMESSFNTNARNRGDGRDGSDSIGISQWNGPRAVALQRFAQARGTSPSDFQTQLAFTMHELGSSERGAGDALRAARTPDEAARAAIGYFRPAGWTAANPAAGHNFSARVQQMQRILPQLSQRQAAAAVQAQDTLEGGDGLDTAPLIDGRTLPQEQPPPASISPASLPAPAMPPADAFGASAGASGAARVNQDAAMGSPVAPLAAPIPQQRPVQIAQQAPMPQARPDIALPPGAQPAGPAPVRPDIARALGVPQLTGGLNERDRLALLRDEQSLAPGEAGALRAGLPGQPGGRLREMLMGTPSAPAAPQGAAPAPAPASTGSVPAARAPAAAPQAGGDQRQRLLAVLMNPNLPASARQVGMAMLSQMQPDTQVITTPDGAIIAVDKRTGQVRNLREAARPPITVGEGQRLVDPQTGRVLAEGGVQQTPDQRNYDMYVRQERAAGRTPDDFTKWMRANRRESSGLDTPDEAFQKELGRGLGQQVTAIIEEGRQAEGDLRNLSQLEGLLGQIGTGATAEAKRRLGELGITFEGTDRIQAANAILNRITPQQRVPGSGATSDFDAKMFRDSLPRLINTPEGNRIIMDSLREVAQNRAARAEIAGKIATGELSRAEGFRQLNDLSRQAREISTRVGAAARGGQQTTSPPPAGAVELLRRDPSPAARREFDDAFGAGASDRILRGR